MVSAFFKTNSMKKILVLGLLALSFSTQAQTKEVFKKKGKTLIFINQDPTLNEATKKGLIKTYFKVFPKLAKDFNKNVTDTITVTIDTAYDGVAYAHNGAIVISADWLKKKPTDTDVITHEVMHIVQAYPGHSGPGWLTEGIADYVREVYGVDNKGADWALPNYSDKQNYDNSYRITARFLVWITQNFDKDFVTKMDSHLRAKTYSSELWKTFTGKDLDALWQAYSANPSIS